MRFQKRQMPRFSGELSSDQKACNNQLQRYLLRRDHSPQELKRKLGTRYTPDVIEAALELARAQGWLKTDQQLSGQLATQLRRRKKSHRQILAAARGKGLPAPASDVEAEFEAAQAIIVRWNNLPKETIARRLGQRGFSSKIIRALLLEK